MLAAAVEHSARSRECRSAGSLNESLRELFERFDLVLAERFFRFCDRRCAMNDWAGNSTSLPISEASSPTAEFLTTCCTVCFRVPHCAKNTPLYFHNPCSSNFATFGKA